MVHGAVRKAGPINLLNFHTDFRGAREAEFKAWWEAWVRQGPTAALRREMRGVSGAADDSATGSDGAAGSSSRAGSGASSAAPEEQLSEAPTVITHTCQVFVVSEAALPAFSSLRALWRAVERAAASSACCAALRPREQAPPACCAGRRPACIHDTHALLARAE